MLAPFDRSPHTPGARKTFKKQAKVREATEYLRSQRRINYRRCVIVLAGIVLLYPLTVSQHTREESDADKAAVNMCNYIGDVAFAISGAVAGGEAGMDLFGCMLMGFVTALGGGSIRDVMLGNLPLFWMTQPEELILVMVVGALTFFAWMPLTRSWLRVTSNDEWLFWVDSLGLGVFAVNGANVAYGHVAGGSVHFGGALLSGFSTACFGGLVRDLCCGNRARILYAEKEAYALPALAGASTHLAILYCTKGLWVLEGLCAGTWITMLLRVVSINQFIVLPTFSTTWRGPCPVHREACTDARAAKSSAAYLPDHDLSLGGDTSVANLAAHEGAGVDASRPLLTAVA